VCAADIFMLLRVLALACLSALLASPAEAQIYAWRDGNGRLVLSDRKLDPLAATYSVAEAAGVVTTRPAVSSAARQRFEPLIREHSRRNDLRPELVRAVIQVESGFNPRARSPKGAMGLMQLMPATARELRVSDPYDPADNIRGGTIYLRQLLDKYHGNEELALAAYNAGSGAVDRHGRAVPPYRETREYVKKVGRVTATTATPPKKNQIYKWIEIVGGRPVPRYSTTPPPGVTYEVVSRR
jgi:soluble lytic murein transglycosylase-like protein